MPLYELQNIRQIYNGYPVLDIDHWQVERGNIVGLFGPNGSGKSTLLKLLGFVERPSSGEIRLNGHITEPFAPSARKKVALLPQQTFLLSRSVYQNVAHGLRLRKMRQGLTERIRESMTMVGLEFDRFSPRPWYALSGGEAHRVALAARLCLRPEVLLMDEPTASVDAASAQHIKSAALHAHRQWGSSLIIASHDIQWLRDFCHETHYLFQGKLSGHGHRTLLFGPWHRSDEDRVCMPMGDGQTFVAASPTSEALRRVAAVDPSRLSLHTGTEPVPAGWWRLQGTLTSLGLDRLSGRIDASVHAGDLVLHALIDPQVLPDSGLTPGRTVWVIYDPDDVVWY